MFSNYLMELHNILMFTDFYQGLEFPKLSAFLPSRKRSFHLFYRNLMFCRRSEWLVRGYKNYTRINECIVDIDKVSL